MSDEKSPTELSAEEKVQQRQPDKDVPLDQDSLDEVAGGRQGSGTFSKQATSQGITICCGDP